jgi:hypothetical protein
MNEMFGMRKKGESIGRVRGAKEKGTEDRGI